MARSRAARRRRNAMRRGMMAPVPYSTGSFAPPSGGRRVAYIPGLGGNLAGTTTTPQWGDLAGFTYTAAGVQFATLAEGARNLGLTARGLPSLSLRVVGVDCAVDFTSNTAFASASNVRLYVGIYIATFNSISGQYSTQDPSNPTDIQRENWLAVRGRAVDLPGGGASAAIFPNDFFNFKIPLNLELQTDEAIMLAVNASATFPTGGSIGAWVNARIALAPPSA